MSQNKHISILRKNLTAFSLTTLLIVALEATATATTYYGKNGTAPNTLTNWGTTSGGGGTNPANFTTAGDVFVIENGTTMTATAAWLIGAAGTTASTLQIDNGGTLAMSTFLLTLASCDFTNSGSYSGSGGVTISGTLVINSIGGFTTTGTVSMTKTAGTATFNGNVGGAALTINGTGGTLNLGSGLTHTFTGVVTLTAGTLNGGSSTLNENAVSGTAWNGTGTVFSAGTGTVNFGAGGAQTLSATATTFNNLTFSNSGTKTLSSATTANGNLTINNGVTVTALAANATMGSLTINSGTLTTSRIITVNGATVITGTINFQTTARADVFSGDITLNSGAVWNEAIAITPTITGSLTNNATTFTASTGLHTFNAASGGTISGATATVIPSVTFTTSYTNSGTLTCATVLNVTGAAVVLTNNGTITATTALSSSGGVTQGTNSTLNIGGTSGITTLTATASGNTVDYNSTTGAQTIKATTYYNLTIDKSGRTGTLGAATAINNNLSVLNGTLADGGFQITGNATGTLTMGANTFLTLGSAATATTFPTNFVAANIALNTTSTVTYNSSVAQTISSVPTYGNLTLTTTLAITKTLDGDLTIVGNLTIGVNNTLSVSGSNYAINIGGNWSSITGSAFTAGTGTVTFNGSGAQQITGTLTPKLFYNLTVANTAGTVTAIRALNIDGDFLMATAGGTFAAGAFTHTVAGNWTISAGTFTNTGSTISFDGTGAQSVSSNQAFNNFTVAKTAGTLTATSALDINGNFVMATAGGTFAAGAFTHNVFGNWTISNGTFTNTGSTINFDGTGAQGVTSNQAFNNFTVAKTAGTLTATAALNIDGSFLMATAGGTFAAGAFTHTVAGDWTISAGTFTNTGSTISFDGTGAQSVSSNQAFNNFTVAKTAGTLTATSALDINGNFVMATAGGTFAAGAFTHTVAGNWTISNGTFTNTGSTISFDGGGAQSVSSNQSFNNLTVAKAGGTLTATTALDLSGNFLMATGGGTFAAGAFTHTVAGSWTISAGTFTAGTGTVNFDGTGAQSVSSNQAFNNFTVAKTAGTLTATSALDINGNFLMATAGGTFAAGAFTHTAAGNWTISDGTFTNTGSTISFDGGAAQGLSSNQSFNNLTVAKAGGTLTATTALDLSGNFVMATAGGTFAAGAFTHTVAGSWTISAGTFTAGTGTVNFDGTGAQSVSSNQAFNNFTVAKTAGTLTATAALNIDGSFLMPTAGGTFAAGAFTHTVAGDWTISAGTFTNTGSTISFDGGGAQSVTSNQSFNNLTVAKAGGTLTAMSGLNIDGNFLISTAGGTFAAGAFTHNVGGNWTYNAGTFTAGTSTITFDGTTQAIGGTLATTFNNLSISTGTTTASTAPTVSGTFTVSNGATYVHTTATAVPGAAWAFGATSTYTFTNSGATIANITYGNVTINIPSGAMNAAGNLQTVAGTLRIQGTGTGSFALASTQSTTTAISGNLQVDAGTVNFSTGTGAPTIGVAGSVLLYGGTLQPATGTGVPQFNVDGDWTNNGGTFTAGTGTVNLNGSGAQAIGGSTTTTFNNLTISNTSAAVSASTNFNVAGTMTVNASAAFSPGAAVVINSAAAAGTISGSGTVQVTRTAPTADYANQYKFTTNTLAGMTVEYAGAGEVLSNLTYGGLKVSGSIVGAGNTATVGGVFTVTGTFTPTSGTITMNNGSSIVYSGGTLTFYGLSIAASATVTASGSFSVSNTLTLGTGAIFTPSGTVTVNGDVSNSGSHTGAGAILLSGGSATHTLSGSGNGSFSNLQLNDAQGSSLSAGMTINGALTLTTGKITTGANTLAISSTGSVSRTSGYVVGNFAKYVSAGSPSLTFEIGDASNYTPVSISFASVSVAGTLTAITTLGDHPNIGTSNVDPAHSVNRYWTLTNTGITFATYNAAFNFVAGDVDAGSDPLTFVVGRYFAGAWTLPTIGARTATSTQATGLTAFSDFQVGQQLGGTFMSVLSGSWSTPGTWDRNSVPVTDADVVIATPVSIDDNTANLKTVTIQNTGVLQGGGSFTLSLGANGGTDFDNSGTFTANSVTVKLNKNSQWVGSGTFNLTTIDFNSNTLTLAFASANTIHLSGSGDPISNPGTLTPGANSAIDYSGTSAQTISSAAGISFNNLQITNGVGVTLKSDLSPSGNLTITSGGVLNTGNGSTAYTIAGAGGSTVLTVGANSKLNIGGAGATAGAFPAGFNTYSLDLSSTVEYSNSSSAVQSVSAVPTYGNLLFSGTGSKSLGSGTINAAGNWTNNSTGGTFDAGTSTVNLTGTSKVINGSAASAFSTISISGSYSINTSISVSTLMTVTGTGSVTVSNGKTLTVTGDLSNDGVFTNNGTVTVQ